MIFPEGSNQGTRSELISINENRMWYLTGKSESPPQMVTVVSTLGPRNERYLKQGYRSLLNEINFIESLEKKRENRCL